MSTGSPEPLRGSCLCGAVRYEADRPVGWAHLCHCGRCRKTRGSAFSANAFVRLDAFRFVQGEERVKSYRPPGAERFQHAFCETCGSTLPFRIETRGLVLLPMGGLDDDPERAFDAQIYVDSKAPWWTIDEALSQHHAELGSGPGRER